MALSVERLERLTERPLQRIGLSATQRPLEEIGRFVSGGRADPARRRGHAQGARPRGRRPGRGHARARLDRRRSRTRYRPTGRRWTRAPSATRSRSGRRSTPRSCGSSEAHRSTIVFVNNRRLAERLALRLNELAEEEVARAHHGSLAREQRVIVEEDLKAGRIPCLVATSSLELGIDMGAVDLVIQVESPKSVARGLQRIGRAGHELRRRLEGPHLPEVPRRPARVARSSRGRCAAARSRRRASRATRSTCSRSRSSRSRPTRRSPSTTCTSSCAARIPFAELSRTQLENVLDMLAGRYPSRRVRRAAAAHRLGPHRRHDPRPRGRAPARGHERRHDPRPRPVRRLPRRRRRPRGRARRGDGLRGARGPDVPARRVDLADRGDHARPRDRLAGARAARARCRSGRARASAGRSSSARRSAPPRASSRRSPTRRPRTRLREEFLLDERAAKNLLTFLREQADATGAAAHRPHDRRRALPRRDRRLARLHPLAVRRPRARAVGDGDDGAAARVARRRRAVDLVGRRDRAALPRRRRAAAGGRPDGRGRTRSRTSSSPSSATRRSFGARFRENASRALLIPRRRPGQRTPLWQQRLKAQSLLQVARRYGSFPVVLETYRECLQDVFDLPALRGLLHGIQTRQLDLVEVETASASPYSASLLFDYVATYMYEDDTPPAERRAQALSLDRELLRELLGQEELRDLLDARRRRRGRAPAARRPAHARRAARPAAPARRPARGRVRRGARAAAARRAPRA